MQGVDVKFIEAFGFRVLWLGVSGGFRAEQGI